MNQEISRFMARTTLYHGIGSSELSGAEASRLGISKALIVTDPGVRAAGLLEAVQVSLSKHKVAFEVFDQVEEDPDVATVHEAALYIRRAGCDGVVVVGGGSAICAAKGAALEAVNPVSSIRELEGINKYRVPPLPVVCLPTTAGSGSDVSYAFPLLDREKGREFSVGGDHIQPPVSILDPALLKTCPPWPMICAGLDALTHAVEALCTVRSNLLTDGLAFEAIGIIAANLRRAALTGDMEAKSRQMLASAVANFACGNAGLGVVHGIGVSARLKGSHGYKCAMLLPHGIAFNMPVCEEKFARAALAMGEPAGPGMGRRELAACFLRRIKELLRDLGFPRRFEAENLDRARIPDLIREVRVFLPPFLENNIRRVSDADIAGICESALRGWDQEEE